MDRMRLHTLRSPLDGDATQLIVMSRYWRPGQTKSRLAKTVGNELAAELHRVSLLTVLDRFAHAADRCVLALWPPKDLHLVATAASQRGWRSVGQVPGDLGAKMSEQFRAAFAAGNDRVVMIGADSPQLPVSVIRQAFAALQKSNVVLGPCEDGGYYLIGGRTQMPSEVFEDVDWGSRCVFQQTCQKLAASHDDYSALPMEFDVDVIQDVERLYGVLTSPAYGEVVWEPLRRICQCCLATQPL